MLASLFSQLTKDTNKLLVVHAFYLYQRHLGDFFLNTPEDFGHVVSLVFGLFGSSSGSHQENDPVVSGHQVFCISASVLEKYFDLYREETCDKLNLYMLDVAPKIFALLMEGVESASDIRYFECIEKYIK